MGEECQRATGAVSDLYVGNLLLLPVTNSSQVTAGDLCIQELLKLCKCSRGDFSSVQGFISSSRWNSRISAESRITKTLVLEYG